MSIDKKKKEFDLPPDLEKAFDEFEANLNEIAKLPKAEREKFADMMREVIGGAPPKEK